MAIVNARPADDEAHRDASEAAPGDVEARLRTALRDAMRTRDVVAAFALRSALSAIGNAEAVPADPDGGAGSPSPHVAGAVPGIGAAEAPRRRLTRADVSGIVRAEAAERATAATQCEHAGHPDRAERLRCEAGILLALLDEMG